LSEKNNHLSRNIVLTINGDIGNQITGAPGMLLHVNGKFTIRTLKSLLFSMGVSFA